MNIASKMSDLADQSIKDSNDSSTIIDHTVVDKLYNKCLNLVEEFARKGNYRIRIQFTNRSFFSWLYTSANNDKHIYSTKYRTVVEVEKLLSNDGFDTTIYKCAFDDAWVLEISW